MLKNLKYPDLNIVSPLHMHQIVNLFDILYTKPIYFKC